MRFLFLVAGWIAGSTLGALAQELPLRETPQGRVFGTERFAVRLDAQTGWAGEVLCDGQVVVKAAGTRQAFDLKQNEAWVTGDGSKLQGLGVDRLAPDTIKSRMRFGEWSVDACLQLFPEQRMLRRWIEITWQGAADTKIKGFWLQGGVLPLGEGGGYFYPAAYPPKRVGAQELEPNRKTSSGRSPYPLIGETGSGWSAVWVTDELPDYSDRGSVSATEGAGQVRVTQSFNMQGHLRKGVTQKVGDAWLWLQPNDAEAALRRMGEWFRLVKQAPPADRPEWLKRVILYSFHPGGTIGSQCKDLGGFKAATELLPHVRDLGCNALWLMPLEDKSIYWPRDYYKFQEGLGTPEDYKALTAKARALGMRVWQDCVPHGGCNEFPRAREHPEWLAQNEDGTTLHYWCFDFNWPTWIDYMSNVVSFYTREYGLDGFRIDAVGGSYIPNWNPAIPYARASHAQAQGGLAMQRALRASVKAVRPDGANLAEVGASIHGAVSDSTYDFDLCYRVLHDLRKLPAEEYVPLLRRWLHEQQCAEIPDLVRMRHVESHDSLRSGLWYGADAQRALVALTSWIHGIPMVYHEMEDGHFDAYRRIFHVRSQVPELSDGAADYLSVTAPAGVFACLRTGTEVASVVLVNLNGKPASGAVAVPAEASRGAGWARDLMTGAKVKVRQGRMEVPLAPFGYTVLRFESKALPELAAVKRSGAANAPAAAGATTAVKSASGTLLLDAKTGLAVAWKAGRKTFPVKMDLALPQASEKAGSAAPVSLRARDNAVEAAYDFAGRALTVTYAPEGDGVEVRAKWPGGPPKDAAVLFDLPAAERWFATTAEGTFGSPFRVRHPECDGVVGSIYRRPQGTATLWDSRLHPFGLDAAHARVGAEVGGRRVSFGFDPARLPASVQLLDRVGDERGLKVLVTWRDSACGVTSGVDEVAFTIRTEAADKGLAAGTGDARLTAAGGGWAFENAHYRARVGRNGVLAGLWRKEGAAWRQVLRRSQVYTDKGFGNDKDYAQEDDVEAEARIERQGDAVTLRFSGELRGFYRFDKMAHPIRFYAAYTFGDGPAFRRTCAFNSSAPSSADYAFLSLISTTEGAERVAFSDAAGEFLTGERGDGKARYAQTAKSADPKRLPGDIRIRSADGSVLRLGDVTWFGLKPANVFMHGRDLHAAWMDGKPDNSGAGQWNGVSLSVACGEGGLAAKDELPVAQGGRADLLQDGGFEQSQDGGGAVLLLAGRALPREQKSHVVWQMPNGSGPATESGSRCVTVVGDGAEYRLIRQALPPQAFPAGSAWRLTARMKGAGVEKADAGWKTACLRWGVSADGRTVYSTASLPFGDSGWREVSVELTVPAGAAGITVEAGLNGNKGRVWIDDVRVEKLETGNRP
jgi:glycosidase